MDTLQPVTDHDLVLPKMNTIDVRNDCQSVVVLHDSQENQPEAKESKKLEWRCIRNATILFLRFDGLGELKILQTADLISELYDYVDRCALPFSVSVVERRWDSLVLMGTSSEGNGHDHRGEENPASMFTLASELFSGLKSTHAYRTGLQLRMGVASGTITLLGSGSGGCWASRSAMGDAAYIAEELAAVRGAETAAVHESALWRWAAAARRLPPDSTEVTLEGGQRRRVGTYDLGRRCFERHAGPGLLSSRAAGAGGGGLRRSASFS